MQHINPKKIILVVNSSNLINQYGQSTTQSIADADDYVIKRGLDPNLRLAFNFGLTQRWSTTQIYDPTALVCTSPARFSGLALIPALQAAALVWSAEGIIFSTYTSTSIDGDKALWSFLSKYPYGEPSVLTWQSMVQNAPQNWIPWAVSDGVASIGAVPNPTAQLPSGRLGCPVTEASSNQIAEYPIIGTLVASTQGTLKSLQGTVVPGSGYTLANGTSLVHLTGGHGSGALVSVYTTPDISNNLATALANSSTLPQTVTIADIVKWGSSGVFLVGTEKIAYSGVTYSTYTSPTSTGNPSIGTLTITQRGYGGTTVAAHAQGAQATFLNTSLGGVAQVIAVESGYGYQVGDMLTATTGDLGPTGSGFTYTVTSVGSSYQIWYNVDPVSLGIAVGQRVRGIFIPELTFVQSISSTPGNYYVSLTRAHALSSTASVTVPITYYNESMTDPALSAYKSTVTNALVAEQESQLSKCHVLSQAVNYRPDWSSYLVLPVSLTDSIIYVNNVSGIPINTGGKGAIWVGQEVMNYTNYNGVTNTLTVVRTNPVTHDAGESVVWINSDNQSALNLAKDNGFSNIYEVCYYGAQYPYAPYYIKDGGGAPDAAAPAIDPAIPPIFCMPLLTSWNSGQGGTLSNGDQHIYFTESMRGRVLPGAWGYTWTSFAYPFGQGLVINGGSAAVITVGEAGVANQRAPGQIFTLAYAYQIPLMQAYFLSSNYPNGILASNAGVIGDPLYNPYKSTPAFMTTAFDVTESAAVARTGGGLGIVSTPPWGDISQAQGPGWGNIPQTQGPGWTDVSQVQNPFWGDIQQAQTPGWGQIATANQYKAVTIALTAGNDSVDGNAFGYLYNDPYYGSFGIVSSTNVFGATLTGIYSTYTIDTYTGIPIYPPLGTSISLSGFTSDPGSGFLTSISTGINTVTLSTAPQAGGTVIYSYDGAGTATWSIPSGLSIPFRVNVYQITFTYGTPLPWSNVTQ